MDIHKNARLTPKGRERIVRQVLSGQTPKASAGLASRSRPRPASRRPLSVGFYVDWA